LLGSQGFLASHTGLACQVHGKLGGDTARTADPKWPRGLFHTIRRHAQYVSWGSWPGGSSSCWGTGCVSFIGWWVIALVHHLFCVYVIITIIIVITFFCFPIKLSLFQPTSFYFFPILVPILWRGEEGACEWAAVWYEVAGWD